MTDHGHHYTNGPTGWTCTICGSHTHVFLADGLCACGTHISSMAHPEYCECAECDRRDLELLRQHSDPYATLAANTETLRGMR